MFWVAPVFYERMEIAKNAALSETGNFDASMRVPDSVREDILWLTNNVDNFRPLFKGVSLILLNQMLHR